jgi:NAD(P)H-dependent FMN reductase
LGESRRFLAAAAAHPAVLTQAFVWLSSASAAGSAVAAAVAGWAVDAGGAHGGFAVAAAAAGVMAVLAVTGLRVPDEPAGRGVTRETAAAGGTALAPAPSAPRSPGGDHR